MKTTIFYFSGTGNSLKVARDIAAELGNTEIVPVVKAIKGNIDISADRIGLVFPVYAFNMPIIISDFIKKLDIPKEKYVFAVTTCASVPGNTLGQAEQELKKKGAELSAGFVIKMPSNYTPFGGAFPLDKQQNMFTKVSEAIKNITGIVKENRKYSKEMPKFLPRSLGSFIYRFSGPMMHSEDKHFWTNDACNGCGICEKVCPVTNVKMSDKKPSWLHKCEQCFACLQWCPQEAIQYGKSTVGRKRYHHPSVTVNDFLQ